MLSIFVNPESVTAPVSVFLASLPWGDVRRVEDVLDSPTLKAKPPFAQIDDGAGGKRRVVEAPYEFSQASSGVRRGAPRRGEHNARVLSDWLEMVPGEIEALEKSGTLLAESSEPPRAAERSFDG